MTTIINANNSGITQTVDTSGILQFQTANTAAITIGTNQNANITSTGAITVPVGTTAQRPASATNGMIRYNTTTVALEGYIGGAWVTIKQSTYSSDYLIVAGGAGGGWRGGSGAGGLLTGSTTLTGGTVYTFVVGAGGTASSANDGISGGNGSNSSFILQMLMKIVGHTRLSPKLIANSASQANFAAEVMFA